MMRFSIPALSSAVALVCACTLPLACSEDEAMGAGPGDRTALELAVEDAGALGQVAPFRFTTSDGREVSERDFAGKVWVVDFFFTTCSGPCPRISAQMRELQDELKDTDVRLVSISVDPSADTPTALADYAARIGADPARWWFLTGDEAATYDLIRSSFALPVERVDEALLGFQVSHATKLVVVDGRGRVRGYYGGETAEGRGMARDRARWLAKDPAR